MADGCAFPVHHPDYLLVGPDRRTAFAYAVTGNEFSILDVLLMTELQFGPLPEPAGSNGEQPASP